MEYLANENDSCLAGFGKTWSAHRRSEHLAARSGSLLVAYNFPSPTANTLDWVLFFPTHHP